MSTAKKALKKLLMVITAITFFITAIGSWALGILGSVIHIWTIIIAFVNKGIIATIITACLPVLAEIYWFIKIWNLAGTLNNPYCITILAFVGVVVIGLLCLGLTAIVGKFSDEN